MAKSRMRAAVRAGGLDPQRLAIKLSSLEWPQHTQQQPALQICEPVFLAYVMIVPTCCQIPHFMLSPSSLGPPVFIGDLPVPGLLHVPSKDEATVALAICKVICILKRSPLKSSSTPVICLQHSLGQPQLWPWSSLSRQLLLQQKGSPASIMTMAGECKLNLWPCRGLVKRYIVPIWGPYPIVALPRSFQSNDVSMPDAYS